MHHYKYLVFALFFCYICNSQELVFEKKLTDKNFDLDDSFSISDPQTEDIVLFFIGTERVKSYRLDNQFAIKDSVSFPSLPKKFASILGYQIDDGAKYTLVLSNNQNSKFGLLECSFEENTSKTQ